MEDLQGIKGLALVFGRTSVAGSVIGGIAETQEVIDYCAARNIKAEIELIRLEEINRAYDRGREQGRALSAAGRDSSRRRSRRTSART